MDAEHFDTLARRLLITPCRRGLLAGLASGLLATVAVSDNDGAAKKNHRKKKRKKRKRATPTCTDGIKNGSETGVDCGGACPRCANGQGCSNDNDCESAWCNNGTCQACTVPDSCGPGCVCRPGLSGSPICVDQTNATIENYCTECPDDTVYCFQIINAECYPRCTS